MVRGRSMLGSFSIRTAAKAEPERTAATLKAWQRWRGTRWVGSALEMEMAGDCDGTWGERVCCKHVLVSCFTCVWLWLAMVGWAAGKLSSVGAELLHILGIERQLEMSQDTG